jgi:hypothetical protein
MIELKAQRRCDSCFEIIDVGVIRCEVAASGMDEGDPLVLVPKVFRFEDTLDPSYHLTFDRPMDEFMCYKCGGK